MTRIPLLMLFAGLLVLGSACSHDSSTPGTWGSPVAPVTPTVLSSSAVTIGPDGGALGVDGVQVTVSAGALHNRVQVTVQLVSLGTERLYVLRPFGLVLSDGGSLRLDRPTTNSVLHLFRLDPASGAWLDLGGLDQLASSTGQVWGVGEHFELDKETSVE